MTTSGNRAPAFKETMVWTEKLSNSHILGGVGGARLQGESQGVGQDGYHTPSATQPWRSKSTVSCCFGYKAISKQKPSGSVEMQGPTISDENHHMGTYKSKIRNAREPRVRKCAGTRGKRAQVRNEQERSGARRRVGGYSHLWSVGCQGLVCPARLKEQGQDRDKTAFRTHYVPLWLAWLYQRCIPDPNLAKFPLPGSRTGTLAEKIKHLN